MRNESENGDRDPSFIWLKMKSAVISIAKEREKQLKTAENRKIEVLKGFYCSVVEDMQRGMDCSVEFESIKTKMNLFYQERSKKKVDKMREVQIDDTVYDIHKLQNQRKYECQKKISKVYINK